MSRRSFQDFVTRMAAGSLFFAVLSPLTARSAPEVKRLVLMTAFAPQLNTDWERIAIRRQESLLQRIFENHWSRFQEEHPDAGPLATFVAHRVDSERAFRFLKSESLSAVFFVSHMGSGQGVRAVLDRNGLDISRVFSATSLKLEFLALIGCHAPQLDVPSSVQVFAQQDLQLADLGLKSALDAYQEKWLNPSNDTFSKPTKPALSPRFGIPVAVRRRIHAPGPGSFLGQQAVPVQVSVGNRVVAVFPSVDFSRSGQNPEPVDQWTYFWMDWNSALPPKIAFFSGITGPESPVVDELGQISVHTESYLKGHYQMMTHRTGRPLGQNSRIFLYRGDPSPLGVKPFN